jgi:hypothetical protein
VIMDRVLRSRLHISSGLSMLSIAESSGRFVRGYEFPLVLFALDGKSVDPFVRDRDIPPVLMLSSPHGHHSASSQFPMVLFSLDSGI